MLRIRDIPFRRRRATATSVPPPGTLKPLAAQILGFQGDAMIVTLTFDTTEDDPLNDTADADPTRWQASFDGIDYVGQSIEAGTFDQVQLVMIPGGDGSASGTLRYAASPSDIGDVDGRMLGVVIGMELGME